MGKMIICSGELGRISPQAKRQDGAYNAGAGGWSTMLRFQNGFCGEGKSAATKTVGAIVIEINVLYFLWCLVVVVVQLTS